MTTQTTLSRTKDEHRLPLLETMLRAQKESGKSVPAQATEMFRLNRGFGHLTAEEYLAYRLFDDARFGPDDKRRFLGVAAEHAVDRICNPELRWRAVVRDKIVFAAMMTGLGFPVPALVAFVHPARRSFMARDLRDRDAVLGFLRGLDRPVFGKPVDSRWSLGTASLENYRAADDSLVAPDGRATPAGTLVDQVMGFADEGYLFQERLVPHPELARACGPAIGAVRMLTGMTADGPRLLATAWKVIGGGNVADNFWRHGNMLAEIDDADGTVRRVASGLGHDSRTHEEHPDTGVRLVGMALPDWDAAVALCLQAATALAGLRLIGWDMALTANGPVIVEANTLPAFNLHQIASGCGLLDDRFEAFVAECRRPRAGTSNRPR